MKKQFLTIFVSAVVLIFPFGLSDASATIPVVDYAAIAQLIKEIEQTIKMIDELKSLNHFELLDHITIGNIHFGQFLTKYKDLFNKIMNEVQGYQNGGLLGQIKRLDEIYAPYYNDWGDPDAFTNDADPLRGELKKQLLWTRIQFKHAAKVAAKVRDSIPDTENQIQGLLNDSQGTVGLLGAIKVGNELTGMLGKTLQTLNLQLTEVIQAQVADGLQRNQLEGLQKNRSREALKGFAEQDINTSPAPINPFGAY